MCFCGARLKRRINPEPPQPHHWIAGMPHTEILSHLHSPHASEPEDCGNLNPPYKLGGPFDLVSRVSKVGYGDYKRVSRGY